ncbi:MAG: four helix bundle protein [Bifidobacteriaceae bacterium]|jgi:four helix bundle protein|nr:four helix bundle protein [Bifidobacteriaceae bacterium]
MRRDITAEKAYTFALKCIQIYRWLSESKKEFVLSKQMLRSCTSIGANVSEAKYAQSRADFLSKMSIALKEARESLYWISLLGDSGYITLEERKTMRSECLELIRLLTSIIKTTKSNILKKGGRLVSDS